MEEQGKFSAQIVQIAVFDKFHSTSVQEQNFGSETLMKTIRITKRCAKHSSDGSYSQKRKIASTVRASGR